MNGVKKAGLLVVAGAMLAAGSAQAAPLIDINILGSLTQAGTYTSQVSAAPGQTVYYEITVNLLGAGTQNGTRTLGTQVVGTNGLNSLNFNLTGTSGGVLFDGASVAFGTNWGSITGASKGTVATNSITNVRPGQSPGTFVGANVANTSIVLTGSFTVPNSFAGGSASVSGAYDSVDNQGGAASAYLTAGPGSGYPKNGTLTITSATEGGAAPYMQFNPLAVTVPEPTSIAFLGVSLLGLVARRRRQI